MNDPTISHWIAQESWTRIEQILRDFDRAWQQGAEPQISQYLDRAGSQDRGPLLQELVAVDLELRAKQGADVRVEHYQSDFPYLFTGDTIPADLIEAEFAARRIVDKLPDRQEIEQRFGDRATDVLEILRRFVNDSHLAYSHEEICAQATFAAGTTSTRHLHALPPPPEAGDRIGRYQLERRVGQGSFSTVWKATDEALRRSVALKILRPDLAFDRSIVERMTREALALASLDHPGIVRVYEAGSQEGVHFIASQFIEGPSLAEHIRTRQDGHEQSARIASAVARAIQTAHLNGVVHRDLKPENILLNDRLEPTVVDFGLVRLPEQKDSTLTQPGEVIGTPAFMSPEQARGENHLIDPRSDIYALGAVLYLMTTGKLPFSGSPTTVLKRILLDDPIPPQRLARSLNRDLETIIMKCLEKEAADRYTSAAQLADDLDRWLQGKTIVARRANPVERAWKWSRRYPRAAILSVVSFVLAGFLLGLAAQLHRVQVQRDRAVTAEQRASNAQNQTQRLLAEATADAGSLAMQRGRIQEAIKHFHQSLEEGYSKPNALRLKLVEALVATRQIKQAARTLSLVTETDGNSESKVLLWKAELALEGRTVFGDPAASLGAAIRLGLAADEQQYARGMLARNSKSAVGHFKEAIRIRPFHHRARRMLVLMLLSQARFQETLEQIRTARQLYPEDQDFALLESITIAAAGDLAEATRLMELTGLPESERRSWLSFTETIHFVTQSLQQSQNSFDGLNSQTLAEISQRFVDDFKPLIAARGWHFPPHLNSVFAAMPEQFRHWRAMDRAMLIDALTSITAVHPEGSLQTLLGGLHLAGDRTTENLSKALALFQQSLSNPAFVHDTHEVARAGVFAAAVYLAVVKKVRVKEHTRLYTKAATEMDPGSIRNPSSCRAIVVGLLHTDDTELARTWADHYLDLAKANENAETTRRDALWHRAIVAERQSDWLRIVRLCDEMVRNNPGDKEAASFRDVALKRIKEAVPTDE